MRRSFYEQLYDERMQLALTYEWFAAWVRLELRRARKRESRAEQKGLARNPLTRVWHLCKWCGRPLPRGRRHGRICRTEAARRDRARGGES